MPNSGVTTSKSLPTFFKISSFFSLSFKVFGVGLNKYYIYICFFKAKEKTIDQRSIFFNLFIFLDMKGKWEFKGRHDYNIETPNKPDPVVIWYKITNEHCKYMYLLHMYYI